MTGSVTELLEHLRDGDDGAVNGLIEYFLPLLRRRLASVASRLRISDEDDIAIAAFYELCRAIEKSRFEDVSDRTQLWQVLSMIAIRKANDFKKFENARRRGGLAPTLSLDSMEYQIADFSSRPDLQLELFEHCDRFFKQLDDAELQKVTQLKMSGYTNSEISDELGVAIRTVQLMVARIKERMLELFSE